MSKIYILDTNVLLHDPKSLFAFEDNEVVIPLVVLDELDKKKVGHDETAKHARMVIRSLDKLRLSGGIHKGAPTPAGGLVRVELNYRNHSVPDLDQSRADNRLISVALGLKSEHPERKVALITKDINLRVKCDALGVVTDDYNADSVAENASSIYEGAKEILVPSQAIDDLYRDECIAADGYGEFYENQYVFMKSTTKQQHTSLARFSKNTFVKIEVPSNVWGISSRNKEQAFALDALFNPNIKLITMIGGAGTGKTLCAVAAGISQVIDSHEYKKLIMTRPVQPMGRDLGYLPGPQPLSSKILTPSGFVTMGELNIGDKVISRNGSPTEVIGIYPKGMKDVYKVLTTEGTSTECCADHLWYTKTYSEKKHNKSGKIRPLSDIMETMKTKNNKVNHFLPRNEIVQYYVSDLPLAPYTLGVLLGDGSFGDSIILSNVDQEIIDRVSNEVEKIGCTLSKQSGINYYFRGNLEHNRPAKRIKITDTSSSTFRIFSSIGDAAREKNINKCTLYSRCVRKSEINGVKYGLEECKTRWQNPVKEIIYNLGLHRKKSTSKFIPDMYKYNSSVSDRIDLLRGLMDSDGTVKKKTGEACFYTVSGKLANDVCEIVRSLGGRARIGIRDRIGNVNENNEKNIITRNVCYYVNVSFVNNINPFYIGRKSKYYKRKYVHEIGIKSIEYVGKKEVQCIMVDNDEHLYLTDDFIVTHNTIDEKMRPWMAPLQDNLDLLFSEKGSNYLEMQRDSGIVEVEALTYIRGRSIPRSYIIVDECLVAGHQISMANGTLKPIEDIAAGDVVLSLDMENNISKPGVVGGLISRMADKILDIKTSMTTIKCTKNHPMYIFRDFVYEKKEAQYIKVGDFIPSPKFVPHEQSNDISANLAYFVGMIISDGHIEKGYRTIKVAAKKDTEHFNKMFVLGASELGCKDCVKISTNKRGNNIIRLHRKRIISDFSNKFEIPPGNKSGVTKVPDEIFKSSLKCVRSFLSACFDAEGDINITKSGSLVINYSSVSKEMVIGVQHLLKKFGISSSVYFDIKRKVNNKTRYIHRVCLTGRSAYDFYNMIGFVMARKQDILDTHFMSHCPLDMSRVPVAEILRKRLKLAGIKRRNPMFANIANSKTIYRYMINERYADMFSKKELDFINTYDFTEVKSVDESDKNSMVYDFKVNGYGTFCVNGIISSNCQNLTLHEIKTVITRVGEGSKVVLTGDILQIDNPFIDSVDNGLSCIVEKFKDQPMAAHITLQKGERSELATLAAEIL